MSLYHHKSSFNHDHDLAFFLVLPKHNQTLTYKVNRGLITEKLSHINYIIYHLGMCYLLPWSKCIPQSLLSCINVAGLQWKRLCQIRKYCVCCLESMLCSRGSPLVSETCGRKHKQTKTDLSHCSQSP